MTMETAPTRPVTHALEEELLGELRRYGVVVWLDLDAHYEGYVDELAQRHAGGEFTAPVAAFRGSWLALMQALDGHAEGLDKSPLLVHLPRHTEETVKPTPAYEVYCAGKRFRKKLETLVTEAAAGRAFPDDIKAFLGQPGLTLAAADAWLAERMRDRDTGLATFVEKQGPVWVVETLVGGRAGLTERVVTDADRDALGGHLLRMTGMDEEWRTFLGAGTSAPELARALAAWLLCVEYVHDLRRAPATTALQRLRGLPKPLVETCGELVRHLREKHPERYERLADQVEADLPEERATIRAQDLGQVDTFRFEEARVLQAALEGALRAAAPSAEAAAWDEPEAMARGREDGRSFWLGRDQARRWAWLLLGEACRFGRALAGAGRPLATVETLEAALDVYAGTAFRVDQAHRHFEQRAATLLDPLLPHFGDLRELRRGLRERYRVWADTLARDFSAICRARGFLPELGRQQRTVFDEVVLPALRGSGAEKTALFLVDALRFEMAAEIAEELRGPGTTVDLRARLAELPSITAVGMNALAPVVQHGRLLAVRAKSGDIIGFRVGEFTVGRPDDRARAMSLRSGSAKVPRLELAKVCDTSLETLKRQVAQAGLVLVSSQELDAAGEAGVGLTSFETLLRQIRAAFHHLHAAGVRRVVITADHGFLLQDETTRVQPYGTCKDPAPRFVLSEYAREEAGMVTVSLAALGYDIEGPPAYLLLREDTAVFATGGGAAPFVHGGNSLQERVVPVLVASRKTPVGASLAAYTVQAEAQADVLGLRSLRLRVLADRAGGALEFAVAGELELSLRVPGRDEVRVRLRDVRGNGVLADGVVRVQVGERWSEVFFALEGPSDEKVSVEVFHPGGRERVTAYRLETLFAVEGQAGREISGGGGPAVAGVGADEWAARLPDEGARVVFRHLAAHGSVTEVELNGMLGSPRAVRQFALRFEELLRLVPFAVEVEMAAAGKRYVRVREG